MSFRIIRERRASFSTIAMAIIIILSIMLAGIAIVFAYLLISGKGSNYMMGTLLSFEFLIAGIEVVLFAKFFITFREVSEDRKEEMLW